MAVKTKSLKRSKPNYVYSIVGVALVLLVMGIMGWIFLNLAQAGNAFKEDIRISAYLRTNNKDTIKQIQEYIASQPFAGLFAVVKAFIWMLQLLEIPSHQHYFLPGILSDEIDDPLMFGKTFGTQLCHGAEDEDLAHRGAPSVRRAHARRPVHDGGRIPHRSVPVVASPVRVAPGAAVKSPRRGWLL